jgi:hypothetical protein
VGSFQKKVLRILFLKKCFVVLKSVSGGVTSENCLVIIFLIQCLKEKRVSKKKFTKHSFSFTFTCFESLSRILFRLSGLLASSFAKD